MIDIFKKHKKSNLITIAECSFMDISDGQIINYFKFLKNKYQFGNLHHYAENKDGILRCIIKTNPRNKKAIMYFNDRCPAMIENEIKEQYKTCKEPMNKEGIEMVCFSTRSPYAECSTLCDEKGNLTKAVLIMIPLSKYSTDYPNTTKIGDGKTQYKYLPYVYRFRLAIPEDTTPFALNAMNIKQFFISIFATKFNVHVLNKEISVTNVKDTVFPRCIEFFLEIDPELKCNEFFKNININEPVSQFYNELNIKLREYLKYF